MSASLQHSILLIPLCFSVLSTALPTPSLEKRKGGGRGGGWKSSAAGGSNLSPESWKKFGIIMGSLVGAAILIFIAYKLHVRRKRKNRQKMKSTPGASQKSPFFPLTRKTFTFSFLRRDQYNKLPPSPDLPASQSLPSYNPNGPYSPAPPERTLLRLPTLSPPPRS